MITIIKTTPAPTGLISLPEMSKDTFLQLVERSHWNITRVKKELGLPDHTNTLRIFRKYGAVPEFKERIGAMLSHTNGNVARIEDTFGIQLTVTPREAASRINIKVTALN